LLVVVVSNGAVTGRNFDGPSRPFDDNNEDVLVTDCLPREELARDATPVIGAEACNNTQTYTQMYTSVHI